MISIQKLSFRYKGKRNNAISDINLTIPENKFTIITGPSGCGKSTLLRSINGLIPHFYEGAYSGNVTIGEKKIHEIPPRFLAKSIGTVFQFPEDQIITRIVERDVAFGLENLGTSRKEMKKRITENLDFVELEGFEKRNTEELSGGQKQKLAIASILAMGAKIILLDEPTAELDPSSSRSILKILKKMTEEKNKTIILVEHRLDEILHLADHIIVMENGKVVKQGNPRKIIFEETLEKIGVGLPKVSRVFRDLIKFGFPSDKIPLNSEEAISILNNLKRG
ncbi:MAG: energy-coupling factor ABC transporter ATP-binding protein [Candidatus Ranarchaeia archaeon]